LDWKQIEALPEDSRIDEAKAQLAAIIRPWLEPAEGKAGTNDPEALFRLDAKPKIIWFVGVNGVGKTTSIAKLATEIKKRGHSVLLAAGDTFRAAASEQLEIWAQRLDIPCIKG